jgi:serine/threonine-protein kinase
VKPANVFVCERGGRADVVKVVDFGLVKATGSLEPSVTATNAVIGTPLYISPESIDRPDEVEARSDLYSLGCLAYFLLTGEPPFSGQSAIEICLGHLHKAPAPPSERLASPLSPAFDALVLDCLAKQTLDRPPSAKALGERLSLLPEFRAFTDSDARTWWEKKGRALKADRPAARSTPPSTIGIDVQHRG